jgi:hypothetical protein
MGFPTQGHTTFHPCLRDLPNTQLMGFPTQGHTTFHLRLREEPHTQSWDSPHYTRAQHSIFVSERNHTPISWAHPTHGLSLRPTHLFCVLEDVSCNCSHQHSLSAREEFSMRPSLSRKYSNFVLDVIINTPSQLGR